MAKGQIGDWFVLYQLAKNCNPYFYREFIRELARELKIKPKKTKSNSIGKMNMPSFELNALMYLFTRQVMEV